MKKRAVYRRARPRGPQAGQPNCWAVQNAMLKGPADFQFFTLICVILFCFHFRFFVWFWASDLPRGLKPGSAATACHGFMFVLLPAIDKPSPAIERPWHLQLIFMAAEQPSLQVADRAGMAEWIAQRDARQPLPPLDAESMKLAGTAVHASPGLVSQALQWTEAELREYLVRPGSLMALKDSGIDVVQLFREKIGEMQWAELPGGKWVQIGRQRTPSTVADQAALAALAVYPCR